MKKTIAILLVLVIAGVGLFASNTQSVLNLSTKVIGVLELGIFSAVKTGNGTFTGPETLAATIDDINQDTDTGLLTSNEELYIAVRTNQRISTKIKISANALSNGNEYMAYNIILGDETTAEDGITVEGTKTVAATSAPTTVTGIVITPKPGLRVLNFPLSFEIEEAQYALANIGDYGADITFNIVAEA